MTPRGGREPMAAAGLGNSRLRALRRRAAGWGRDAGLRGTYWWRKGMGRGAAVLEFERSIAAAMAAMGGNGSSSSLGKRLGGVLGGGKDEW